MTDRRRQWVATAASFALVLAIAVGWLSYLHARNTPTFAQVPPGGLADPAPEGGMPMRLASLTLTQLLVTDRELNAAPAGALWVIAVVDYAPPPEGAFCRLDLLAVDGRRWTSMSSLDYEGSRTLSGDCSATPGDGTPRVELIYQIPEDAAAELAGLVNAVNGYRGIGARAVLTPPG